VDAHVGKALFEQCIVGELRAKGKTVVLVTNQLSLLAAVDDVVVMRDGNASAEATPRPTQLLAARCLLLAACCSLLAARYGWIPC